MRTIGQPCAGDCTPHRAEGQRQLYSKLSRNRMSHWLLNALHQGVKPVAWSHAASIAGSALGVVSSGLEHRLLSPSCSDDGAGGTAPVRRLLPTLKAARFVKPAREGIGPLRRFW